MPGLPRPVDTSHTHLTESLVDRETRAPYPLKEEVAEAKTLPESGGEQRVRLLRSEQISFDADGLVNPDDAGRDTGIVVPLGAQIIQTSIVRTALWDIAPLTELYIGPNADAAFTLSRWLVGAGSTGPAVVWAGAANDDVVEIQSSLTKSWMADDEWHIYVAMWPSADDPTSGSLVVSALIAEPAE